MLADLDQRAAPYFEPVHPPIRTGRYDQLLTLLTARKDLLSGWREEDFQARTVDFKILGRQVVVANEPEAIRQILAREDDVFHRKSPQMRQALVPLLGDGLFVSDGAVWRERRPLVAEIVHKNRVPDFTGQIYKAAAEMEHDWLSREGERGVDLLREMGLLAAEIVSRTIFGAPLGREKATKVVEGFSAYEAAIDSLNLGYFLGFDEGLPVRRSKRLRTSITQVQDVIAEVLARQLSGEAVRTPMLDALARQHQKGRTELDQEALRNEAVTLFMAGYETTATIMAWCWYLLSRASWAANRFFQEVAAVCGDREPTHRDLASLPYVRAVVDEAMRLYPPVPILARQAARAVEVSGIAIEPGALVIVSPWLLHRSPDLWLEPHRFYPDRFLGADASAGYRFIPFAAGPRLCPGMNFGIAEAMMCLVVLGRRLAPEVEDPSRVGVRCRLTLRPVGLTATLTRRRLR